MKNLITLAVILTCISGSSFSQTLFSEDFESGSPSSAWQLYRQGEETLQAIDIATVPDVLANGGSYAGLLQDSDGSYSGAALALAGDTLDQDYTIEGDVYCYNNHSGGSAYTGLVVYADSSHQGSASHGYYVKLVADFDADNRFRLYNNQLSMSTFQYTFHHSIDASGFDTAEGWHHLKVRVETLSDGTTKYTCWYDSQPLGEYIDDSVDRVAHGQYGVYSFQMDSDGIAGYFDNIVVTPNTTDQLFAEDFESGSPSSAWQLYRQGEEILQAIDIATVPDVLANGGSYAGLLQDSDGSYSGAALALAGDTLDQDYTIEGDVYCYNNHSGGSAYTGLVVYADSSHQGSASHGYYVKLVADFDADNRFRLYNNQLSMSTFQYTFHHSIDASGFDTAEGWHHMKVRVETLSDGTTKYTCWYDSQPLGEYIDDSVDRVAHGQYGVYSFQMDSDGIAGYFDNIVVTPNEDLGTEPEPDLPLEFSLLQNYPNPFNPATTITFRLERGNRIALDIYNLNGQQVRSLVNEYLSPGTYSLTWDGTNAAGVRVPSGVYIYSLARGPQRLSKKMSLVK